MEIQLNNNYTNEIETAVKTVMDMLTTGQDKYGEGTKGHAYLDWFSYVYKNCPSKRVADEVGRRFKEKGYYVYYQTMGRGNKHVAEGTPICMRIQDEPHRYNNLVEF